MLGDGNGRSHNSSIFIADSAQSVLTKHFIAPLYLTRDRPLIEQFSRSSHLRKGNNDLELTFQLEYHLSTFLFLTVL